MKIRPYQKADWARLCEIHDRSRLDELRGSVDLAAFLTLEQTAENEGLFDDQLLVAELENRVVGFIAFDPSEITWLYVDPGYYRKGIGRKLIQTAIDNCGNKITIEVLTGNLPALKLYQSFGFQITETRKGQLTGNETFDAEGYILELLS